jgi:hypothetical protein
MTCPKRSQRSPGRDRPDRSPTNGSFREAGSARVAGHGGFAESRTVAYLQGQLVIRRSTIEGDSHASR